MEPNQNEIPEWWVFTGTADEKQGGDKQKYKKVIDNTPPWRNFEDESFKDRSKKRGEAFYLDPEDTDDQKLLNAINAAIYLRKPLIVTGDTGVGKSSLAYAIAYKLGIFDLADEEVLTWPITSHTTIKDGLYNYEVVSHITNNTQPPKRTIKIEDHITLNELGTALATPMGSANGALPRVLLIDEIDKADMDLPNNLLNILEDGRFYINELNTKNHQQNTENQQSETNKTITIPDKFGKSIEVKNGWIECKSFPIVIITSNGERDLPNAFRRRCISVKVNFPSEVKLKKIIRRQFGEELLSDKEFTDLLNTLQNNEEYNQSGGVDALLNIIQFKKKILKNEEENWHAIIELFQFNC